MPVLEAEFKEDTYLRILSWMGSVFEMKSSTDPETETPEVDDVRNAKSMHDALYDFYQCSDDLMEGDSFDTPFGTYHCRSFHVLDAAGVIEYDAAASKEEMV